MLGELADRSRINESVLRSELKKIKRKAGLHTVEGLRIARTALNREEHLLLSAIIAFPEKADYVLSSLDIEDLRDETIRSIFKKIKTSADGFNMSSFLNKAEDAERTLITELSLNPGFDLEHVDRNIDDCLQTMVQKRFEERKRLADAKESDDVALHDSFLKEKRRLIKGVKM
jgi:hypothetical protein